MGRNHSYVLIGAICLHLGCSRDPQPVPAAKPFDQKPAVQAPVYSAAGIVPSGATESAPVAPGGVVSIYGWYLGPVQSCHGSSEPNRLETPNPRRPIQTLIEKQIFPGKLCDTEVFVGGAAAGLLYVSARQINFKVPQKAQTEGETSVRVVYRGQAGPSVTIPLTASPQGSAEQIAATMWSDLQNVKWQREYQPVCGQCVAVPPRQGIRGGLHGQAYYCAQTKQDVIAESFYYPVDHSDPKLVLLRADIRPVNAYPELSAEVEQLLIRRLEKAYGAGATPERLFEIGANLPEPGLSWATGDIAIFLHRNRNYVEPAGVRWGVILIAVRREVLEERRAVQRMSDASISSSALSSAALARDLDEHLPGWYFSASGKPPASEADRAKAEQRTRVALLRLLRQSTGEPEDRAASLVAADDLARRLASLLVARAIENGSERLSVATNASNVSKQLSAYGVKLGEVGHYSGDLRYDHSLLKRAWKEYPGTRWGQRAFLMLQRLSCATPHLGCKGLNCFLSVVKQGEQFLERYPETTLRREQTYHLALAYETWWSLSQAEPGDPSTEGAAVPKSSGEGARLRAIELYEEILRTSPGSIEAQFALTRLKLKLATGERTFFCFSC